MSTLTATPNNGIKSKLMWAGIAVLGAIFQSQIVAHTSAALSKTIYGHEVLQRGGAQLKGALSAGEVQAVASSIPVPAARHALLSAYHVGFSTTLNHLMDIAAAVAFVGVLCGFLLVRQSDFVIPTATVRPADGGTAPPADAGVPAAHA